MVEQRWQSDGQLLQAWSYMTIHCNNRTSRVYCKHSNKAVVTTFNKSNTYQSITQKLVHYTQYWAAGVNHKTKFNNFTNQQCTYVIAEVVSLKYI